jgi:hypothetical protein
VSECCREAVLDESVVDRLAAEQGSEVQRRDKGLDRPIDPLRAYVSVQRGVAKQRRDRVKARSPEGGGHSPSSGSSARATASAATSRTVSGAARRSAIGCERAQVAGWVAGVGDANGALGEHIQTTARPAELTTHLLA